MERVLAGVCLEQVAPRVLRRQLRVSDLRWVCRAVLHMDWIGGLPRGYAHCALSSRPVADLAHLDVRSNRLRRLPASLSQCIKLTALLLGHNDDLDPLGLIDASVLTLASLPALQRVQLPYTPAAFGFRLKLKAAAPHIKDITIPS